MKSTFYSDNGKPCYRCSGTIYKYDCDDAVSLVETSCVTCRARDLFYVKQTPTSAAEASAAHRGKPK